MLKLKMLLSKTSIKKYVAMQNAQCADGRIRGLLSFMVLIVLDVGQVD